MDVDGLLKLGASVLAAAGGPAVLVRLIAWLFPHPANRLRREIRRNIELLEGIPSTSPAHTMLLEAIERDTSDLLSWATTARRDTLRIILGVVFLLLALAAGWWALRVEGWLTVLLWVLCASLTLFGVVGAADGLKVAPRDDTGRITGPSSGHQNPELPDEENPLD